MSVFQSIPCCLDYQSFVVQFEIREHGTSSVPCSSSTDLLFDFFVFKDLNLPGKIFFLLINSLLLFLSSLSCLSEFSCSLNFFMITILNSLSDHDIPCLTIGFWRTAISFFIQFSCGSSWSLKSSSLAGPTAVVNVFFFFLSNFFLLIVMIQWVGN